MLLLLLLIVVAVSVLMGFWLAKRRYAAKGGIRPPQTQADAASSGAYREDSDSAAKNTGNEPNEPGTSGWDGGRAKTDTSRSLPEERKESARPQSTNKLVFGEVRYFNVRKEVKGGFFDPSRELQVWTFRVYADSRDRYGNDVYQIEMRGRNFSGALTNGDQVGFFRKDIRKDNLPIKLSKIANMSAGGAIVSAI